MLVFPLFYIKFSTNKKQIIMKIELKHIAPYLPYGLKTVNFNTNGLLDKPLFSKIIPSNILGFIDGSTESKILLRPLSDLTKEIEVNGEKFVPRDLLISWNKGVYYTSEGVKLYFDEVCYKDIQKLFEWHIDVFGLIPQGLAISCNDL